MNPRDVPIPALMQHLKLDKRGYPIIPIVLTDKDGPMFAVNDEAVRRSMLEDDCCGICGKKLYRARWLVGGPGSAFLEFGAFLDPPAHGECMRYALMVCPYLAAPRWSGSVAKKQIGSANMGPGVKLVPASNGADPLFPNRPEIFVAVQYTGRVLHVHGSDGSIVLRPPQPYRQVEYWSGGKQMTDAEGREVCKVVLDDMMATFEKEHGVPTYSNLPK